MIIGITGGVGTGKTTILEILEKEYDAKIIMADEVAKFLQEPGNKCYEPIVEAFGEGILDMDEPGRPINRGKLAEIVFNDADRLEELNYIVHPIVKTEIMCEISGIYHQDVDSLIVVEAALLIESGYTAFTDELWIITADKETRIARLMESRGYSREKCEAIMKTQLDFELFYEDANLIVDNSGSIESTRKQIADRLSEILDR